MARRETLPNCQCNRGQLPTPVTVGGLNPPPSSPIGDNSNSFSVPIHCYSATVAGWVADVSHGVNAMQPVLQQKPETRALEAQHAAAPIPNQAKSPEACGLSSNCYLSLS